MDLLITIDTEADNQWARLDTLSMENTRFLPRFQALCDRFGFKPTYLCTHEMVTDPLFQETVGPYQTSGRAEIGAHLHPWTTPPFGAEEADGIKLRTFPNELPIDLFERKMVTLTEAISDAFGAAPTSYRAGRYGFCESHIDVLVRLGYLVDCSIAPYMTYQSVKGLPGGVGGPDFQSARPGAYFLCDVDCTQAGESPLLEVPITILFPKWPLRGWPRMQRWCVDHAGGFWARALNKCGYGPQWFRPSRRSTAPQLVAIYRAARRLGLPCVEMIFHSSELMPGCSPTFPDEASIEALYETFERTFVDIAANGGRAVTLTEFARDYRRAETSP